MSGRKLAISAGALVFLLIAAASLYRLLVGFPITIGGLQVGQTVSLLVFVSCAALSVILFKSVNMENRM
ncbi:MAG: hypothetical protein ACJ8EY_11930 [Sphingomicrobium sp.]